MIVGPIQFDRPLWLLLAPICWVLVWLISRRSLSGLGPVTRPVAIGIRCLVLGLLAAALAEPNIRRVGKGVSVIAVLDKSQSMPRAAGEKLRGYLAEATKDAKPEDRMGVVTVAEQGRAQELPSTQVSPAVLVEDRLKRGDDWDVGPREATNLGEAVRLAMALKPEDTAARILLFSDGNENVGSLLSGAEAARAAGIPIDVLPSRYDIKSEVVLDQIVAPATARKGQTVDVRLLLTATRPTKGKLGLLVNGRPYDLNGGEAGALQSVELAEGPNVLKVPVEMLAGGPQQFQAVFEPEDAGSDMFVQNNRAESVTFVSTEGRALILAENDKAAASIAEMLDGLRIGVDIKPPSEGPASIVELQRYDAVFLVSVPASAFSGRQIQELVSYVRDSGGGLVMVGGENSFGAGGWIGTPLADALPVRLDPPQKRQIPRGAMVMLMHSCEMPQGNFWGQKTAQAAVDALSRLDLIGVMEAQFAGQGWVYPLSPKGDGSGVSKAIAQLNFSDMFDYTPPMQVALKALQEAKAGFKHMLIISDGDPQGPPPALLAQFVQSKVTVSCVEVFPHGSQFGNTMANIAKVTGGNHYTINTLGQVAKLPQIFIKEAQVIRRTLIWEGDPMQPAVTGASETMRGLGGVLPPITGYVVTADREGLSQITSRAPGENPDPITAQWQYGLGRVVAVTTDSAARWSRSWLSWAGFRSFWEQHARWVMRPSGSTNVSVVTQSDGGVTRVVATMLDNNGEPLNFARLTAKAVAPDLAGVDFEMRQTGPGRYEGRFESGKEGSYLVNLRYDTTRLGGGGRAEAGAVNAVGDAGSVQVAVTKRGADEYRALRDNAALLEQAASVTGGRVLPDAPAGAALFSRDGLTMPVALRPIWLATALLAVGLFLVDVAVRRVRIDLVAMARALRRGVKRGAEARSMEGGALLKAREQARARMGAGGASASAEGGTESTSAVKFDAGANTGPVAPVVSEMRAPVESKAAKPAEATEKSIDAEQGMSRLLKAKRKAQEGMKDE
ncbi:MAG: hypothetical protein ACKVZJ_01100 [Phycisphaerales bacterium]